MTSNKSTLITTVFAISFFLFSFNTRAIENIEYKIDENAPVLRMEVSIPSANEINFFLYNANERMVFSERTLLDESFESQFDFSEYRQGTYTLISEVENMRYTKVLEVKDAKVEIMDSYYSFKPVFRQEGNFLTVHFINNEESDIALSIQDGSNTYYDAYYGNEDHIFQKVYSLENFKTGEYVFKFIANGEFFDHEFKID